MSNNELIERLRAIEQKAPIKNNETDLAKLAADALEAMDYKIDDLSKALEDAMAGMRYIRGIHGELNGVGFDRVQINGTRALKKASHE